jgi:hypothetical protein
MPVSNQHPLYNRALPLWMLCRRAVAGNYAVKFSRQTDLPAAFADTDEDRYNQYIARAYFLGVTGRTKEAFTGMVFRKAPRYELPPQVERFVENIDGAGQSLEQLSKETVGELLTVGRYGLLVDYSQSPDGIDAESERRLGLRPTIATYPAESIINWRFEGVQGKKTLTLVVLAEAVETNDDEFAHDTDIVYRVLRLRDGVYTQTVYDEAGVQITEEYEPRMAGGATFDHIPFHIMGSVNNFPDPDVPPLYDMAVLNVSHYQNTADLEESSFIAGQPTYHLNIGETEPQEWQALNPSGLLVGSRKGVLTKGGSLEQVQAAPNNLPFELMRHKEQQMVAIGARLVQRGGQAETAEASRINASAEAATLDSLVGNASEGIEAALEDMALFVGASPADVIFDLNKDFWETGLSAQDLQAIQGGVGTLYGPLDALEMIRQGRIVLSDERTNEEIAQDAASAMLDGGGEL